MMVLAGNSRICRECDGIVHLDQHHVSEKVAFGQGDISDDEINWVIGVLNTRDMD